jgi:hypothetical protein
VANANSVTVTSTTLVNGTNGRADNYSLAAGQTTPAHITPLPAYGIAPVVALAIATLPNGSNPDLLVAYAAALGKSAPPVVTTASIERSEPVEPQAHAQRVNFLASAPTSIAQIGTVVIRNGGIKLPANITTTFPSESSRTGDAE